jgi:hypothetical protein
MQQYAEVLSPPWMREHSRIVAYEDIASNAQEVFDSSVHPFLGTEGARVETALVKQRNRPVEEVVENFEEIREQISKYEQFIPPQG